MSLTQSRLKKLLHYDPLTGVFTWLVTRGGTARAGSVAGGPNDDGYWHVKIDHVSYKCHRLAWLYMTGEWPEHQIDHRDLDPANNRWKNLRPATGTQNRHNTKIPKNNTSGIRGVTWSKKEGKWIAQIGAGPVATRTTIRLGAFASIEDAAAARRNAEIALFGEFSPLAKSG